MKARKLKDLSPSERKKYDSLYLELKAIRAKIRGFHRRKNTSLLDWKDHYDRIMKAADLLYKINKIIYKPFF
jgi:hypothetical protein